ncbi:MAG TPA: hypothetical protein VH650_01540 [Gaiellaceae bacterium]|jgi:ribosomal protein S18 acetylase RimI-like enzyme
MGVRRAFSGRGIGTALLRALGLYLRSGFEIEATRRRSLLVDGRDVDELAMARLFDPASRRPRPRA